MNEKDLVFKAQIPNSQNFLVLRRDGDIFVSHVYNPEIDCLCLGHYYGGIMANAIEQYLERCKNYQIPVKVN